MRNKKIAAIFMIAVLLVSVFVFAACEDPAVKVIYKDINPKYETDDSVEEYITVGEAEIKPDMTLLELSKDGFALEAWTTDKEGQNVFDPTKTYTQNVVVYAKWHRLPAMPANLAYDPDTHTVSWTAVSGATGYMIQLDDNAEQLVVTTCPKKCSTARTPSRSPPRKTIIPHRRQTCPFPSTASSPSST